MVPTAGGAIRSRPPSDLQGDGIVSRYARILIAVASLLLASGFVLPLWRVGLIAPQYPEGLGMLIKVNTVVGMKEQDLHSINGLNHYIGMQKIEPDTIPELKLMPVILGALVLTGLGVAALGKKWPMTFWAAALGGLQVTGLIDFWKWEYDYGHDLDTVNAIIKIPGMSYQPPVIGSKRPSCFAATNVVPEPMNGSITVSLGNENLATAQFITFNGFGHVCSNSSLPRMNPTDAPPLMRNVSLLVTPLMFPNPTKSFP